MRDDGGLATSPLVGYTLLVAGKVLLALSILFLTLPAVASADVPAPVLVRSAATAVAISDDGRFVATSDDRGVRLWDRRTGKAARVLSSRGRPSVGFVAR